MAKGKWQKWTRLTCIEALIRTSLKRRGKMLLWSTTKTGIHISQYPLMNSRRLVLQHPHLESHPSSKPFFIAPRPSGAVMTMGNCRNLGMVAQHLLGHAINPPGSPAASLGTTPSRDPRNNCAISSAIKLYIFASLWLMKQLCMRVPYLSQILYPNSAGPCCI